MEESKTGSRWILSYDWKILYAMGPASSLLAEIKGIAPGAGSAI